MKFSPTTVCLTLSLLGGLALAGGGTAVVPGHLGLHGSATDPPSDVQVDTGVGGEVKRVTPLIPEFTYVAPTGGTDVGGPLTSGQSYVAGTYHYSSANVNGGTLSFTGGGTVSLHFRGNVSLDSVTIDLQDGTNLVIYGDAGVTIVSPTYTGNGQVQIQAAGDITVRTTSFRGAALANNKLTLSASNLGNISLDDSLLTAQQAGASKTLKIMPIVEK